jgi:fused signal recognition particle receptor
MFDSLKKKLSGWFRKKPEEEVVEAEVKEVRKEKKEKEKVEEKPKKKDVKKKTEKKAIVKKKDKSSIKKIEGSKKEEKEIEKKEEKKEAEELVEEIEGIDERVEERLKERADRIEEEVHLEPSFDEQLRGEGMGVGVKEKLEERAEEMGKKFEEKEEEGFFAKLKKKISTSVLKQEEFDEMFEELEMTLLENNVALGVVDKIKEELGKDVVGISVKKKEVERVIMESLREAIGLVLVEGEDLIKRIREKNGVYVILFFGINGSGKTTSVAKIAHMLKEEGISSVMAAGDTFRAASIEQLEEHGRKIGVEVVKGEYGKDPASVAFDAISYAKKNKKKVVLIDTAGRMYTKSNLMKEMEKIVRVANADLKIFVGEAITGNDATEQAKMFNETAGIDGSILTKADVDDKAGAILSVGHVTGKPILYLGTGQEYEDLERFSKDKVLKGLGLEE